MKRIEGACPSCGGNVEFLHDSALVVVCPWCHSAVARGDRNLEDRGRVADLVETDSPLELGQRGRFRDKPFEIVGHVQYRHAAGGVWDEWYASFPGERWAWIAVAQGKLVLTVSKKSDQDQPWPTFESLSSGRPIDLGPLGKWNVIEVGSALTAGAEGELPRDFTSGKPHRFADLSGPNSRFGTIDFNHDRPVLFAGYEVSLADLGLAPPVLNESEPREIPTLALTCTQCGGSLDLLAPDQAQRIICPFCAAMLDVNDGKLSYLATLKKPKFLNLPLGRAGTLLGQNYTVIGFIQRAVKFDREYTWEEYLLFSKEIGFRWLVHSDGHWSFVEPIPLGDIHRFESGLRFNEAAFRLFQRAWARVKFALGEFYWKVALGDTVLAEDFIAPPRMISLEYTPSAKPDPNLRKAIGAEKFKIVETNASLATYLPHETIEQAFQVQLPRSWAVAPNQPQPISVDAYAVWIGFIGLLVAIFLGIRLFRTDLDPWNLVWATALISVPALGACLFNYNFETTRWADSEFNPANDDSNPNAGNFSFGDDDD